MKKLLGLLLVLTMGYPVSADVLKNVDLKGEVQVIGSDVRDHRLEYNTGTSLRVLAGASFDLVEDVRANLLFGYTNNLGSSTDGVKGSNVQHYWDNVDLAEANIVLSNLFDCFELTIGRQFYGDEDSAVMYFGPNHYNAETNDWWAALDAVKFNYADDYKSFTMIAGKMLGTDTPLTDGFEGEVYGADFKLNLGDNFKWQVYGYNFQNLKYYDEEIPGEVIVEDQNAGFYGTKLTFAPEAFTLSAEYARNFGGERLVKEHQGTGYFVKADAALNLEAFTPRAAFVYSNEFLGFGNYMPGLLVGDSEDVLAQEIRLYNIGVDYNTGKWTFALDGYAFQDRYGHHAATLEADLTANYAHNEYVDLFAGIGYAKFGTEAKADEGRDNTKGQLGILVKF